MTGNISKMRHIWRTLIKSKVGSVRSPFKSDIWPCINKLPIKVATEASDFGWRGNTLDGIYHIAHGFFSVWDSIQFSTFRGLLGVIRCLQSLNEICKNNLVKVQADAMNLLGIVNKGSPRLAIEHLGTRFFWVCLSHKINISVEWATSAINAFADAISK